MNDAAIRSRDFDGLFATRRVAGHGCEVAGHGCDKETEVSLEEEAAFNALSAEFIAQADAGAWRPCDPRADPAQVMHVD